MYLALLLVCTGCYVLIDRRWRLYFWSGAPTRAWLVLVVGVAFFLAWDLVGILNGVFWHGENSLSLGVFLAPELPVEEVFFLAFLCYQTMIYVLGAPMLWRWWRSTERSAPWPTTRLTSRSSDRATTRSSAPSSAGDGALS